MALGLTPEQIIEKKTHPLLKISKRWARVELKYIAYVQNGFAFKSDYFNHNEGMPLIRIRDIDKSRTENLYSGDYSEEYIVNNKDILVGMDGDFKASMWPGTKGLLNQRVCRVNHFSKHYERNFLFLCLQPYLNAINEETSSITVKHLSSRTINEIPLPLPPLPEQRAIVAKIEQLFSELDSGIANLKAAKEKLEIYRQAVLKKAFEGELTKEWREKQENLPTADEILEQVQEERQKYYESKLDKWNKSIEKWEASGKQGKKPIKPKTTKNFPPFSSDEQAQFSNIPDAWGWVKIDKIIEHDQNSIKAGPFGSSLKKESYVKNGYKIYGQEQVIAGNWKIGDYYVNENKYNELASCAVQPNDVLISLVGTVGKVLVLPETVKPGIINPRLIKISLSESLYSPYFFKYYFESTYLKSLYATKSHGATMDIINLGIIQELPFPLMAKKEQDQIVQEIETRLSVCDNIQTNIEEGLKKAEALRQSILKKAFEGRLLNEKELEDCRKEPDWEPADKLLERIKKSKEEDA